MKINFLKFNKKQGLPSLKSLRPQLFKIDEFWFAGLVSCLILLLIMAITGFSFFYSQYFESYKKFAPTENFEEIMGTSKLNSAVSDRNSLINQEVTLPRDPSI